MAIKAQLQEPVLSPRAATPEAATEDHPAQAAAPAIAKSSAAHQSSDAQQSSPATSPAQEFSISTSAAITAKTLTVTATAPAPVQAAATTTLNQVLESADKMRTIGQDTVQLQVNLDGGQQLTVRLQMAQGAIHATFKTDSPDLRQAIEQNWSGFRTGASERGLQISSPVFESPSTGSGFNAFANRDQTRQQNGDPSDAEASNIIPLPTLAPAGKAAAPQPAAASPVESGIQLYA